MKWILYLLVTLWCSTYTIGALGREDGVEGDLDWKDYRIVVERNIFSPDRGPKPKKASPAPPPSPKPEYIDCTGALVGPERSVAFFEGSLFTGSHTGKEGETIAGHTVVRITTNSIVLRGKEGEKILPVGERLLIYEGDKWETEARAYTAEKERDPDETRSLFEKEAKEREARRRERSERFRSFFEGFGERRRRF